MASSSGPRPTGPRMPADTRQPQRTAAQLARAVAAGRGVAEALRHLDARGNEPDAGIVADALARFLVARCDSRHAGWRGVRPGVVHPAAGPPRGGRAPPAIPPVGGDPFRTSAPGGPPPPLR